MIIATSLAELMQALIAVAAVVYAIVQWRQVKRNHVADLRPYVTVQYTRFEHAEGSRVYLVFTNFGRTPAQHVRLRFEKSALFKGVGHTKFPFLTESGISLIAPGQQLSFMVGRYNQEFDQV